MVLLETLAVIGAQAVGGRLEIPYQYHGWTVEGRFGSSVAGAGDVNADGYEDFLIGAVGTSVPNANYGGLARAYSGRDGSVLFHFSRGPSDGFGQSVSGVGDLDQDGHDDMMVGATNLGRSAGAVLVYSGRDGRLLRRFDGIGSCDYLGMAVSGAGDVNGDGAPDLMMSALTKVARGRVEVRSGADGSLLYEFFGQVENDRWGKVLDAAGDIDGDGHDDLLVGSDEYYSDHAGIRYGRAAVYSGRDGQLLFDRFGLRSTGRSPGRAVSGAGDLDSDGLADFLITQGEAVVAWSWRNGQLYSAQPPRAGSCGSLDGGRDVDGDGVPDFLVGSVRSSEPWYAVCLMSGRDGRLLGSVLSKKLFSHFGHAVAWAGDLDGDGRSEAIVSAVAHSNASAQEAGSVFVFRWDPFLTLNEEQLSATSGAPVTASLDFPGAEAGAAYALLASLQGSGPVSLGGVQLPLTMDALLLRMLGGWIPPNVPRAHGTLNPEGDATVLIHSTPLLAPYVGQQLWLAAISFDAAGQTARRSSVARTLTVVP